MRSLVLKIFLAYWCAAGIVIFIADFEPHWPPHNPELADALNTFLKMHGRALISAYESGNCSNALYPWKTSGNRIYLFTSDGQIVCGETPHFDVKKLVEEAAASNKLTIDNKGSSRLIALPVTSVGGKTYLLLTESQLPHPYRAYKHLPGNTSIAISGVVTFLLAVLVAYPIRRIRTATWQIAEGNLDTRLQTTWLSRIAAKLHLEDDVDHLLGDFNAMAERLQSLVDAQRLLMRDVSHELRSPLARLAVALELGRRSDPTVLHVHLDRIEKESIRLNNLIAQILTLSYIQSISQPRHVVNVSLEKLVQDLVPDIQYEAASRKCRIVNTSTLEHIVKGDPEMLRHALENVVRNAVRYSPTNGIVEIDIHAYGQDIARKAVIRVTDSGPGVDDDKLQLIMNPFYRADKTRSGSTAGFGVGLAIADRALQLHSGTISASNRNGGGLIVELSIPLEA